MYEENKGIIKDLVDLINEINVDIFSNSRYYFRLIINNLSYPYYLFSNNIFETIYDMRINIKFYGLQSHYPCYNIIDNKNIDKKDILRWMLDIIFKEDLSC